MNNALETMLDQYDPQNNTERENAVREIIQEIALCGLSRTDFFKKVAFYGGQWRKPKERYAPFLSAPKIKKECLNKS